jgi:molybdenum cofactor biosynthesis enzyme MoaA
MQPRVLLVNPAVFDFAAYDFWLKPYGLLTVAGRLRGRAEFVLYDYLDCCHPFVAEKKLKRDAWGRGELLSTPTAKPAVFAEIPRRFHRFGLPRALFQEFLRSQKNFDFALVQTGMTYWYPGVQEVLEDLRRMSPSTRVVLGGVYASLCPAHARTLGADLVIEGSRLDPMWGLIGIQPHAGAPLWESYPQLSAGVLKLTDGCPFRCTYCAVPQLYPGFQPRAPENVWNEFELLRKCGVENIAFYDDALLHQPEHALIPFLERVVSSNAKANFHTPNALNARFITPELARLMVRAGFKAIYLGFESAARQWHARTGGKLDSDDLARAVANLKSAGADPRLIKAYLLLGHPQADQQQVETSMRYAHGLGLRVMLSEFSPLPNTPDGEACRRWVNLDEPLCHNKTAFAITALGATEVNRLKNLCRALNQDADSGRAATQRRG